MEGSMLSLFISAFLLGLLFNAAPGAILAETIRQGLAGGFRPALAVQLGSLAGDATWAVIGLAGVGFLFQMDALRWPIGLTGAGYLVWLAWDIWRSAGTAKGVHAQGAGAVGICPGDAPRLQAGRSPFASGALISLTNPQNVVYWAALGSAMGAVGVADPVFADYALFFIAFMTSSVLWCFFCAAVVGRIFGRANALWARVTYRLCALALLALAVGSVRNLMVATS